MDKAAATKLLAGTITRGLLWATAALSTRIGIDNLGEDTATALGAFAAAAIVAGISAWWSKRKDKKLLAMPQS